MHPARRRGAWHCGRMPPFSISAGEAEALANEVLRTKPIRIESVPVGFGNQNWRVVDAAGRGYVLKLGPRESTAKWTTARKSYELAASVGVPLPRLVHFAQREDCVVRMYEWIDGRSPVDSIPKSTVRLVHCARDRDRCAPFDRTRRLGSRLDGSAPSFRRWADYVDYRLRQIRPRCSQPGVLDRPTLDRTCAAIRDLAGEVSDTARPTLCHRDLYADNLVVDDHGALLAILDWDMAEAWIPRPSGSSSTGCCSPSFRAPEATFDAAYHAVHHEPALWARRKQLVDLMETLNAVANATLQAWHADFEAVCPIPPPIATRSESLSELAIRTRTAASSGITGAS